MINFGDLLIYITTFFGLYTSIYFLFTLAESRKRLHLGDCSKYPPVTICVPCFNEETTIEKTLQSLCKLDYDKSQLEIILVDDGSSDNTYSKALKFSKKHSQFDIKVFRKENGGKHTAVNYALERSRGEFFGVLDADSFVDKMALRRIIKIFEDNKVDAVTPSMLIYKPKNILERVQYIEYLLGVFLRKIFAQLGSQHVTPGPFSFFRKTVFDKYGKYRKAHNTEDIEMALRIQSHNGIIENALDAYVYTTGVSDLKGLYKQRLRWYHGFLRNVIDYKNLFSKKHGNLGIFILPASFISVFLVIIFLFYTIIKIAKVWIIKYLNLAAVNFDFTKLKWFNWDTFFINTNGVAILGIITFIFAIAIIIIAKKLSKERLAITPSYVLFILTYWILFGFWWCAAVFATVFTKGQIKWGHKSGEL